MKKIKRFLLGLLIVFLYLGLSVSMGFHARGAFLCQFYLLLMLLPPTVAAFLSSASRHKAINGVLLGVQLLLLAVFFRGLLDWHLCAWLGLTFLLMRKLSGMQNKPSNSGQVSDNHLTIRIVAFAFIGLWFFSTESNRFTDDEVKGLLKVPVTSIGDVSDMTKYALSSRADVMADSYAYMGDDGLFTFRVMPVRGNLFSQPQYRVIGNGETLDQIVAEIRLVSAVRQDIGGVGNFALNAVRGAWGLVKGIVSLVFHPINTVKGLYAFVCHVLSVGVHAPSSLITEPLEMFQEYRESLNKQLADTYGVRIEDICLSETYSALSAHQWSSIAGVATVEVAATILPAAKAGKLKSLLKAGKRKALVESSERVIPRQTATENLLGGTERIIPRLPAPKSPVPSVDWSSVTSVKPSDMLKDVPVGWKPDAWPMPLIEGADSAIIRQPFPTTLIKGADAETHLNRVTKKISREFDSEPKLSQQTASKAEKKADEIRSRQTKPSKKSDVESAGKSQSNKIVKNGPEDQAFDAGKNTGTASHGSNVHDENAFQKGDSGISGRKPTPDGLDVDDANHTKTYWEDKRPSECGNNSWLSTYKNDPLAAIRTKARADWKAGKITRAEAEARVIAAEHDLHYALKGKRWNDPTGVSSQRYVDRLGFRLPDTAQNQERIDALIKMLQDAKRNPKVQRENGISFITYDPLP